MTKMPQHLVDEHGPFCAYCGLPFDSHPVEYSQMNGKDGYLCEEPQPREDDPRERDPGAYSASIDTPGTSKSAERKQKEDHVW